MQRWHKEIAIMRNRLKLMQAIQLASNSVWEDFPTFNKKGVYRKIHPLSNNTLRSWRRIGQYIAKKKTKQKRRWKYQGD